MALQGTLDTFALPDVLRLLAATQKTGRVHVTGPRGTGSVWMDAGGVGRIEAPNAPHASAPVDALFELLRFDEGSFSFDGDVMAMDLNDEPAPATTDVESLLSDAEALLVEWRQIESVVPSMDAWVTLRRDLVAPTVSVDRTQWTTVVAIGSGATVRRMSDALCLSELPVSRAVRDLIELGLVDIDATPRPEVAAPATPDRAGAHLSHDAPAVPEPVVVDSVLPLIPGLDDEAPLPVARPLRARRPRPTVALESTEPESFVPLDLPGHGPAVSYDAMDPADAPEVPDDTAPVTSDEDLTAMFPGLADGPAEASDDEDLARQLATLSPRAAEAVRMAAGAATDEERDAALAEVEATEDGPINRGLLLKFLSSVKS